MLFKLALKDLIFDKWMSICTTITICAIIAPLLLLYSLRFGIVNTMQQNIILDPDALRITFRTGAKLDKAFFDTMRANKNVSFVIEQTREISNNLVIAFKNKRINVNAEASGFGDPILLRSDLSSEFKEKGLYISKAAALALSVDVGDSVTLQIARIANEERQIVRLPFSILGIIKAEYEKREAIYLPLNVIEAIEDYKSGFEPFIISDGSKRNLNRDYYEKAIIYAKDIYSLESIVTYLESQGYDIKSKLYKVQDLKNIKATLDFIFLVIALASSFCAFLVLIGFITGSIRRKLKSIALMRLIGLSPFKIKLMIIMQNIILAFIGSLLALIFFKIGSYIFNYKFKINLGQDSLVSTLMPEHIAIAMLLSCSIAFIACLLSLKGLLKNFNVADKLREI